VASANPGKRRRTVPASAGPPPPEPASATAAKPPVDQTGKPVLRWPDQPASGPLLKTVTPPHLSITVLLTVFLSVDLIRGFAIPRSPQRPPSCAPDRTIDGKAVVVGADGVVMFDALHRRHRLPMRELCASRAPPIRGE
jgi:hypothetical protein